jgi:hypothetical protein
MSAVLKALKAAAEESFELFYVNACVLGLLELT